MGYNSDLFLALRDEEVNNNVYFEGKSKKEVVLSAEQFADDIIESGEVDTFEALSKLVKLRDYLQVLEKKIREDVEFNFPDGDLYVKNGMKFEYSDGTKRLNFSDDPVYNELQTKLKEREALLKVAYNSKDSIYDSEGIEVPKVSASFTKSFLKITY